MSTHDHEQRDERYEALCAYVLGELPDDERARVERELAASPELRAQKDELEATIGLVRGSLGNGDELSEEAAASVLARVGGASGATAPAEPAAPRPRFQLLRGNPFVRVAAGVLFLAVGFAGLRLVIDEPVERPVLDGSELARGEPVPEEQIRMLRELGYVDGGEEASSTAFSASDPHARAIAGEKSGAASLGLVAKEQVALARKGGAAGGGAGGSTPYPQNPGLALKGGQGPVGTYGGPVDTPSTGRFGARRATEPALGDSLQAGADGVFTDRDSSLQDVEAALQQQLSALGYYADGGGGSSAPSNPTQTSTGHIVLAPPVSGAAGGDLRGFDLPLDRLGGSPASGALANQGPSGPTSPGASTGQFGTAAGQFEGTVTNHFGQPDAPPTAEEREVLGRDLERLGEADAGDVFESALGRRTWTVAERERYLDRESRRILDGCRRRPDEHPRDMFFRYWGDNAFEYAELDPLSTFAADVDTASYTLARNYLTKGMIPPKAQVRTEEFVNYFRPDVPAPLEGTFAVHTELAPSRFGGGDPNLWMLSVAVRGREVGATERKPLRLTFVVDTSGSMKEEQRLELVKHALRLLLGQLDGNDAIALVAFAQDARVILPMTPASQRGVIEAALYPLAASGGTNAEAGLKLGYELARAGLAENAVNRVVLLSDGVANIGETDQDRINADVAQHRARGVYLNTVGVGMGNHNDAFLEQLANKGDGLCSYVDGPAAARKALVENFTGQFEPIARDVKLQVEFDPQQVVRYRLLGYENRAIADADFRNDAVDAGELNAGHQVVALYELERTNAVVGADGETPPLATVRLRWKPPHGEGAQPETFSNRIPVVPAQEREHAVHAARATSYEGASYGHRRAVVVAQFAELLRRSRHAREDSLDDLIAEAEALRAQAPDDRELAELVVLLQQSRALILRAIPDCDELCRTVDELRLRNLRVARVELLQPDSKLVRDLERQNQELEGAIRELLRQRLEQQGR